MRLIIDGIESGGGAFRIEHPMSARLAAPLHRHSREDEYSYVVEGRVGALLGDEVLVGGPGDLILKPRGQWHTFLECRRRARLAVGGHFPAGFERYFVELVELGGSRAEPKTSPVLGRYGLETNPQSTLSSCSVSS